MDGRAHRLPVTLATLLAFALVSACTATPSPPPTAPQTSAPIQTDLNGRPSVLYVENRGGPAFVVRINGTDALSVACNTYPSLAPGEGGVAALPWDVSFVRDGVVVYSAHVSRLPAWYVQIGDTLLGLGYDPVLGPPGPSCPPGSTPGGT